jgi:predicted nucleic acid-binding protein
LTIGATGDQVEPSTHKAIAIDCNVLVAWCSKGTAQDDQARLDHFLEQVGKRRQRLIIPMPVLAEFLVRTDTATTGWLAGLEKRSSVVAAPFDRIAAFECAAMDRAALGAGDKKDGLNTPWQKIKIDRQIIAIAKAQGATLIITSDDGLRKTALRVGMSALSVGELQLPLMQRELPGVPPVKKS